MSSPPPLAAPSGGHRPSRVARRSSCAFPFAPTTVKRYLDTGCDGIILPQVSTLQDVEQIARAALYPPLGQRSVGIARAQAYGARFAECLQTRDYAILVQIETVTGVTNAEAIVSHHAVDGVLIGPYDLSGSYGLPGQIDAPQVSEAIDSVFRICRTHRKPCGIFAANAENARGCLKAGFDLVGAGIDSAILLNAYKALRNSIAP